MTIQRCRVYQPCVMRWPWLCSNRWTCSLWLSPFGSSRTSTTSLRTWICWTGAGATWDWTAPGAAGCRRSCMTIWCAAWRPPSTAASTPGPAWSRWATWRRTRRSPRGACRPCRPVRSWRCCPSRSSTATCDHDGPACNNDTKTHVSAKNLPVERVHGYWPGLFQFRLEQRLLHVAFEVSQLDGILFRVRPVNVTIDPVHRQTIGWWQAALHHDGPFSTLVDRRSRVKNEQ